MSADPTAPSDEARSPAAPAAVWWALAELRIRPGAEAAFRAFELRAMRIMAGHGGRIAAAYRTDRTHSPDAWADALHLVSFPDGRAFEAYRTDPALAALADERAACIAETRLTRLRWDAALAGTAP